MIVARINEDSELFIKGNLEEGHSRISLNGSGNLFVKKIYTKLDAINDATSVDSDYEINDDVTFDENDSIENFFAFFFGILTEEVSPNMVQFDKSENIIANNILENQDLGDE